MRAEIHHRKFLNITVRLVLVITILFQSLAMPFMVQAASPRQQILAFKQQANESDDAYLERMAVAQPDLFQSAAITAVQDAFNGNTAADEPLEAKIASYLDQAVEAALANPSAISTANTDGSFDDEGNYNWSSTTYDEQGNASGAWQLDAQPKGDPAIFEEVFESKLAERGYITPAQSGESPAAAPSANSDAQPFGPSLPPAALSQPADSNLPANFGFQEPQPVAPAIATPQHQTQDSALVAPPLPAPSFGETDPHVLGDERPLLPVADTHNVVDTADDNLRLLAGSPAIDIGENSAVPGSLEVDLDSNLRFHDNPSIANTGSSIATIVDAGAYEFQSDSCTGLTAVYVDDSATGNNDGTSWTDAYTDLTSSFQHSLACGLEVWVAEGIYSPGPDQFDYFQPPAGVTLYGGFAGSETSRSQRDWEAHPSILSGDINGDDQTVNGVVTNPDNIIGVNNTRIVSLMGTYTAATVLDGFTITGASIESGIFCRTISATSQCSPTLRNLKVIGNRGGGIQFWAWYGGKANATLDNVLFEANRATGGGMYLNARHFGSEASPTLNNVTFYKNAAPSSSGGGMYIVSEQGGKANPTLNNVTFIDNVAAGTGGGLYGYNTDTDSELKPTLMGVKFISNEATTGGGAYFEASSTAPSMNPTFNSVLFSGNSATAGNGGAIYFKSPDAFDTDYWLTLNNATVYGNQASASGGGIYMNGTFSIANSIFWSNTASTSNPDLYIWSGPSNWSYSIIPGRSGTGMINANPQFEDADGADNIPGTIDDNFRLLETSPAIDAGNNNAVPVNARDLDSNPRIMNSTVDMGAYEFTPWVTIPGLDGAVYDLAVTSNGTLFAAGAFSNYVASFDGTNWTTLPGLDDPVYALWLADDNTLYAAGDFTGGVAQWTGAAWQAVGANPPAGTVKTLTRAADGIFYAGGDFGVSSFNATQGGNWQAVGADLSNVRAVAVYNGDLYAGGNFNSGNLLGYIARWNGTAWQTVTDANNPNGLDKPVNAFTEYAGRLAIGGAFTAAADGLIFWDGHQFTALSGVDNATQNAEITDLYATGGLLAVVGDFDEAGGDTASDLAIWTGTRFITGVGGLYETNNRLEAVALVGGDLYAGGGFEKIGGRDTPNVGKLDPETADLRVTLNAPTTLQWPTDTQLTMTVTNDGATTVANATVGMWLPFGFDYVSSNSGNCSQSNGLVSCTITNLAASASQSFVVTANVVNGANTPAIVPAFAAATTLDSTPANNLAQASIDLTIDPDLLTDLGISLTTEAVLVNYQDVVTYTVTVSNTGTGAGRDVLATITMPNGGLYQGVSGATCTLSGINALCDLNQMDPNTGTTFDIYVQMNGNGTVRAQATIADQSSNPVTFEANTDNNSATSPPVLVFSANRTHRVVGNVVVAANSFETIDGVVTALGGVELGVLDESNNPVYTVQLAGALDAISWTEGVENGNPPPAGQPALSGHGSVAALSTGLIYFVGDFQISSASVPALASVGNVTTEITKLAGFNLDGGLTYTGISLADGSAAVTADIIITPPGISITTQATGQLLPDGSFSGTIPTLTFMLSALEIKANNLPIEAGTIRANTLTITLPSALGGGTGNATDLLITHSYVRIGAVGAKLPLPNIPLGNGQTLNITDVEATVGFFGGVYAVQAKGTLAITLPENNLAADVEFSIDGTGNIEGLVVEEITLNLAGASLVLAEGLLSNEGIATDAGVLSQGGANVTVRQITITPAGLSIGGNGAKIPFPDVSLGQSAVIYNLEAQLTVDNSGGSPHYTFNLTGKTRFLLPGNTKTVNFTGQMSQGAMSGTAAEFSLKLNGSTLRLVNMTFANGKFSLPTAPLTLPAALSSRSLTVNNIVIDQNGLAVDGGVAEVTLADVPLAGNSAIVQLLLSGILYIKTGSSVSFEVGGKLRALVSGQTVDLVSTFTINSQGQINAKIPDFEITVVGLSVTTNGVVLRNGVLQATEASITTPKGWGGVKAAVYDLRIGNGNFSLGGGEFALPPIDLGGVKFKVSGGFQRNGNQLIIKAAGLVAIKNIPENTPGCYGLGVALTIYVNVSGNLVANVEPAPTTRVPVAAAASGGNGFSATISAEECEIPITGTGFKISRISGTFALLDDADVVRIELAVEFSSEFEVLDEPAVSSEPRLGIEVATDGRYMQIDFAATAEIFSMFTAAELEAGLRIGQKKPGDADAVFKAELKIDMVIIKGEAYFAAWTQDGSFHLVGGGRLQIGVAKGDVWHGCIKIPLLGEACINIPPFDLFARVGTDFGEFQRGSGTTWGLKTYYNVIAYEVGIYINTSGDFKFGSVSEYQTVTPPELLRAKELQQTVKAQRRPLASLSATEQNLYNTYHFTQDATLIDFTVQHGDITINFGHAVQDTGLELRLIRPDGLEMTLNNLPTGMTAYSFPMEVENDTGDVEMIHTMISLTDAMPGVWQMKLIGADTATYGYILNALGNTGGPTVDDLALTQLDGTHAKVAWSVSSAVPTTTLSIYATAGPITATETITVSEGITDTLVVERYSGAPILANATTTLDGRVQTADIDFSTWESGEYWVWIDANDDMNPPTREYFPGKVIVEHPWAETWTASTVITPSFRTLDVAWDSHPNQDVDDYEVWITPDGDNFESQEAQKIAVGDTLVTHIPSLEPNKSYTVKVVAVDLDTNRQSESETSQATAGGAPFTMVANPSALTVSGGSVGAVELTLTTAEEPFPARVVLSAASETGDLTTTFLTEVVTPTLAGVSATANITVPTSLASGIYTVTVRASAAGEVRLIDIPVTVQAPHFALQGSPESVTLTAGATTSVDIDAAYLFGEDDDIFVTLENVPEGMEATFDEQLFAVGEKVTLTLGDTSLLTNGSYTLTVVGNDGDHEETLDITVIVSKPTFGFSDSYSTHAQALHGQTVTYTVGLEGNDWQTAVNLGFDSLSLGGYLTPTLIIPSGATSIVPPATFKVAVTVPVSTTTPAGNYEMVLQATSEGITQKLPLHLLVGPADPKPDLRVSYELSASEVTAGDLVTLTVRYENQGAIGVNTDLGGGFSHTRLITASEPLLIPQAVAGCDTLVSGTDTDGFDGTYQCDAFGTLQPGDFFSRTTVYRVHEGATDGATATISEMVAIPNDYDLDDNGWQASLTVHNSSDVAVALSSSVASQNAGEAVTYSATVKTNGPANASNTQLTFALDEAMSVQGMSPACSLVAGVVRCEVGFLESGCERPFASDPFTCNPANATTKTMTVTVTLDPAATGSVLASTTASSEIVDPNLTNNSASKTVTVTTATALHHTMTAEVEESNEGGTHTHTIVVTNDGPSLARNVYIAYTLPPHAKFGELQVNGVAADSDGYPRIVDGVDLLPGEAVTLTLNIVHLQDTDGAWLNSNVEYGAAEVAAQTFNLRRRVFNVAPTVDFELPAVVAEGDRLQLIATASDVTPVDETGAGWSISWDLNGDGDFSDATGSVAELSATALDGDLVDAAISVRVTDGISTTQTTHTFTIQNVAPKVDAGEDQLLPASQSFTVVADFADPAAADTHTAVVNWGDGTEEAATVKNNAVSANHTYATVGTYQAEVCVTDDDGGEGCDTVQLQAACVDHGLVTDGLTTQLLNGNLSVATQLSYLGTLLPSPLPSEVKVSLYDGETVLDTLVVANAFTIGYTDRLTFGPYEDVAFGSHPLTVRVDDDGAGGHPLQLCVSASAAANVEATPPPVADAGGPYAVAEGSTIALDASATTDPNQEAATLTYEWDFDGDGSYNDATGIAPNFSALDGTSSVTVGLKVTNATNNSSSTTATVNVSNVAPSISSVSNDGPVGEGNSVTIAITASDPAGENDPLNYAFDCDNDGDYEVGPQRGSSTGCTVGDDGTVQVNVRVTDGDGGEDVDATLVTVNNLDPVISSVSNNGPVEAGDNATITVSATDVDRLSYEFDCDNNGSYEIGPQASNTAICSYPRIGEYPVNVRVTDGDGGEATDQTTVMVFVYPATCDITAEYVNVIYGTDRNDKLVGTPDHDIIFGLGGNDRISGMGGNDCLIGGLGNDQLFGGDGSDILWGGEVDNSTLYASKDRDRLFGGAGRDELHGGGDKDRLDGNDGDDTMYGDDDDDTMVGSTGDDTMVGGAGRDNLRGDDGNDRMYGEAGNDRLYGRQGDDILDGGADTDQLDGSDGTDMCIAGEKLKSCELDEPVVPTDSNQGQPSGIGHAVSRRLRIQ